MTKQIALITGTSSGIGLATAVRLAQDGFHVVATMRNLAKAQPLKDAAAQAGVTLELRPMDVQDETSVAACVRDVVAAHGRIDLLVNNAGAGYFGTLEEVPLADAQQLMDVNFFGVWRVTQAVLPVMRAARRGRIITVSSILGVVGVAFNDAYSATKFAIEGLMESMAPVVRRLGIHVSLVQPGPVNTEFIAAAHGAQAQSQTQLLEDYAPLRAADQARLAAAFNTAGQSGADIAAVISQVAHAAQPHFRNPTSPMVQARVAAKLVDPTGDSAVAAAGIRLPPL